MGMMLRFYRGGITVDYDALPWHRRMNLFNLMVETLEGDDD